MKAASLEAFYQTINSNKLLDGIKKNYFCMHYNWYLYWLSVQAVPMTDIVKNSISAANIIANPIIDITLLQLCLSVYKCISYYVKERLFINSVS